MSHAVPPSDGVPKTGFYKSPGAYGGASTLAGVLLAGFLRIIRRLLDKAAIGTEQFKRLREIESKVADLMKLVNKVGTKGKLPANLASQIQKLVGKGPGDFGELGKLIEGMKDEGYAQASVTKASLLANLKQVKQDLTAGTLQSIAQMVAALNEFDSMLEAMEHSKGDAAKFWTGARRKELIEVMIRLTGAIKQFEEVCKTQSRLPAPLRRLYDAVKGLGNLGMIIKASRDQTKEGRFLYDQLLKILYDEAPKERVKVGQVLADAKAVTPADAGKISLQQLLEAIHEQIEKTPGAISGIAIRWRNATNAISKMLNTCAQTSPDVVTYIKASTQQINQLVQQLNNMLNTTNRLVYGEIQQIRPKS